MVGMTRLFMILEVLIQAVPAVMDKYDQSEWCTCLPTVEKNGKEYPPMGYARHHMEQKNL